MSEYIDEVAKALLKARHVVALTGAGVSVPSGIPDFRDPGGLWSRYEIAEYSTIYAYRANPEKVWQMFHEIHEFIDNSQPNRAHLALAELERLGRLECVITQNIDRLHQKAGSSAVLEFHGSAEWYHCVFCGSRTTEAEALTRTDSMRIPRCQCGRPLKPAVVLFGESIPLEVMKRSTIVAEHADMILVVGTSASVAPASDLPRLVASRGGLVVEFNMNRTALSHAAKLHVPGDVSETLPAVVEKLRELLGNPTGD